MTTLPDASVVASHSKFTVFLPKFLLNVWFQVHRAAYEKFGQLQKLFRELENQR